MKRILTLGLALLMLALAGCSAEVADYRQRFIHAWQDIEKLGFDDRFRRMWLYYFGYCEAGFNARTISVVQLTAERTS